MIRPKNCIDCDECQYVGEGDYACMLSEPRIVIENFCYPTDDHGWCRREAEER